MEEGVSFVRKNLIGGEGGRIFSVNGELEVVQEYELHEGEITKLDAAQQEEVPFV